MKISCVDLFCGVGGLTFGLEKEGIDVITGVDIDPACGFAYEENNRSKFVLRDVREIRSSEIESYWSDAEIRLLAGCAPCQPFSTYSQRYDGTDDDRWGLLDQFSRLVRYSAPDFVTMENVPRLERHSIFKKFVRSLERRGYFTWHEVVDSSSFGVPQSRKRMVLLASLWGPIELNAPKRKRTKTVRQAIGDMNPVAAGQGDPSDRMHVASALSVKNMQRIRASKPGGTWRDWPPRLIADCHKAETGRTYPGVYGRMEWDKLAPTLTTQCYGYGNGRFGHPVQDRAITLREAAILQGFPKKYKFVSNSAKVEFTPMGRLIGNSVPIGLARAIGKSIRNHADEYS